MLVIERLSPWSLPAVGALLPAALLLVGCSTAGASRPTVASSAATPAMTPAPRAGAAADTTRDDGPPPSADVPRLMGATLLFTGSPAAASCVDRVGRAAYTRVAVYASATTSDSTLSPNAKRRLLDGADLLLQAVAERARTMLRGSKAGGVDSLPFGEPLLGDSLHVWAGVGSWLELTAYGDGRVTWRVPWSRQGDTAAVALLARVLDSMRVSGEATLFRPSDPAAPAPDSAHFEFSILWPTVDHDGKAIPPRSERPAQPLFSMLVPWMDPAHVAKGAMPTYPGVALSRGYRGTVIMQFVVDTTGRAEPRTVRDLWPPRVPRLAPNKEMVYQAFVEASRDAVVRTRYAPARIGGCPVKQIVQQPYEYDIAH